MPLHDVKERRSESTTGTARNTRKPKTHGETNAKPARCSSRVRSRNRRERIARGRLVAETLHHLQEFFAVDEERA